MTEAEWLACTDPVLMLRLLQGKVGHRKLRLFSAACCKQVSQVLSERESDSLQLAEKYADEFVTGGSGQTEEEARYAVSNAIAVANACAVACARATHSAADAAHAGRLAVKALISSYLDSGGLRAGSEADADAVSCRTGSGDRSIQTALLRCVIGNPFRLVTLAPACLAWNEGTVKRLAESIYNDQAFHLLPVLADALEDAGCDNADILTHCRRHKEHVRGCWVPDLLLGMS
jgi:hypothetical protein